MSDNIKEFTAKIKNMSFEEALKELENIVKRLETGKETLENAIEDYEKANILKNHCEAVLKQAKLRIDKVIQNTDGTISTEENVG